MSAIASKRLQREASLMSRVPPEDGVSMKPVDPSNLSIWEGEIVGPSTTPYEGGVFKLRLTFSPQYPFEPPKVIFLTKIYHMNISSSGHICLDILKDKWVAGISIHKLLIAVRSLLAAPNPNSPLVESIASLFLENEERHNEQARRLTAQYAKP